MAITVFVIRSQKDETAAPPAPTVSASTASALSRRHAGGSDGRLRGSGHRQQFARRADNRELRVLRLHPWSPSRTLLARRFPPVASIDTGTGRGSGFFIRPDLVVTNDHVVEGQNSVPLRAAGAQYTARVMTTSPPVDLALLQVYNANPQQATLRLGTAATRAAGEEVIAIGYALGTLSNTVTRGIVSATASGGQRYAHPDRRGYQSGQQRRTR